MNLDVIVPTAHLDRWPAKASLRWNAQRTAHLPGVRYIPIESSGPDFSFSKSVNRGIAMARPDADVFLLNDDVFMSSYFVERLMLGKRSHPECGIFGALLRFPRAEDTKVHGNAFSGERALTHFGSARYQHAGGYIPLNAKERLYGLARFALWNMSPLWVLRQVMRTHELQFQFPGHYHSLSRRNRIDLVTAAAMLITRPTLERIGLFDEDFAFGFEDISFCLTASAAGVKICLVSDCEGVHYESASSRHMEDTKRRSYDTFRKKWGTTAIRRIIEANGYSGAVVHPELCQCGADLPD